MVDRHSPEAPRDSRGASPWLLDFYGSTGVYVAAWCRLAAIAWSATTGVVLVLAAVLWSLSLLLAGGMAALFTAAHIWLGFFYLANPEWKHKPDEEDDDGDA